MQRRVARVQCQPAPHIAQHVLAVLLLGMANAGMPVVVLKPLAESVSRFVHDRLAPYATSCLELLRSRGGKAVPANAVALTHATHMKDARGSMFRRRLNWFTRTVELEAAAVVELARAYGLQPPALPALKPYLHEHMRRSMLGDPLGCLKPEWLPVEYNSDLAKQAQADLQLSSEARSKLAQAYGARPCTRTARAAPHA